MKYLLTLLSFFLIISCATNKSTKYSKIEYEAGACFGFCPIFKITINPDRTAIIDAERFTFTEGHSNNEYSAPKEGIFKATISQTNYNKLVEMLDSLDLKILNNYYGNKNVSDLPTSNLKITFADGTEKIIEDYGKRGTPELDKLYDFIEELRKNQTWTKVGN